MKKIETVDDAIASMGGKDKLIDFINEHLLDSMRSHVQMEEPLVVKLTIVDARGKLKEYDAVILEENIKHSYLAGQGLVTHGDGILYWVPKGNRFEFGYYSNLALRHIAYANDVQETSYWRRRH